MDQIKPYLFWIICGVILLIELVMIFTMEPVNDNNHNVYKATRELNATVKNFQSDYVARTQERPPASFAIDDVSYFNRIQDDYLVSENWLNGLRQVERDLDTHKQNVEESLRKRSAVLHQPITEATSKAEWYSAYVDESSKLLAQLRAEGCLAQMPNDPFARELTPDKEKETYEINDKLRDTGGFYTKGMQFPSSEEHPIITTRFRISQAVIQATLEAEGALLNNDMARFEGSNFLKEAAGVVKPRLMEITWDSGRNRWDTENRIAVKGGSAITFKVKARGSVSALLALTAQIEMSQDPIFIIHGSEWNQPRLGNTSDVEKRMDADIELTLDMAVLDYQGGQQ